MTKLNLLGAQRVKALIEVLNDKEKQEIRAVEQARMTRTEAESKIAKDLGVSELLTRVEDIKDELSAINRTLSSTVGYTYSLDKERPYRSQVAKEFNAKVDDMLKEDIGDSIERIKADYREREQRLWLCETLDEAKEIVGIE